MTSLRLSELDALRVIGLSFVLIAHLPTYLNGDQLLSTLIAINVSFSMAFLGLSLFFFVSGFVIYRNNAIRNKRDTTEFLKKRVLRIYPLYWAALLVFIVGATAKGVSLGSTLYDLSPATILIQVVGAQGLLSPRFVTPILTLWFVGVILICYTLYPLVAFFSDSSTQLTLSILGSFILFVTLRVAFGIVDFRFFVFYAIFIAGVLFSKCDVLYKPGSRSPLIRYAPFLSLTAVLIVIVFINLSISNANALDVNEASLFSIPTIFAIILADALALWFIYSLFGTIRLCTPRLSQNTLRLVFILSFASYAAYLFHRPFLGTVAELLALIHVQAFVSDLTVIVFAVPLLFVFSYFIQSKENDLMNWLKHTWQERLLGRLLLNH
jgi:peptidoglycan/LPS O-acetylase OafA/YrhL